VSVKGGEKEKRVKEKTHILLRQVVPVAQLSRPPLSKRVHDEISSIEIPVRLMPGEDARLHRDKHAIVVGPAGAHRRPRVGLVRKVVVEREAVPELAGNLRVVVEHRHGLGGVSSVTLEEGVHREVCHAPRAKFSLGSTTKGYSEMEQTNRIAGRRT
jgi:hypothetical protein